MNTIDKVADFMIQSFCDMDADECEEVIEAAQELSPTNCWYPKYWVKDIVIKFANNRIKQLELFKNPKQ